MIGDLIIGLLLVYGYFAWVEPRLKSRIEWLRTRVVGPRHLIAGDDLTALRDAICRELAQSDNRRSADVQRAIAAKERAESVARAASERASQAQARVQELEEQVRAAEAPEPSRTVILEVRSQVRRRLHPDQFEGDRRDAANRGFQECEAVFREMLASHSAR